MFINPSCNLRMQRPEWQKRHRLMVGWGCQLEPVRKWPPFLISHCLFLLLKPFIVPVSRMTHLEASPHPGGEVGYYLLFPSSRISLLRVESSLVCPMVTSSACTWQDMNLRWVSLVSDFPIPCAEAGLCSLGLWFTVIE